MLFKSKNLVFPTAKGFFLLNFFSWSASKFHSFFDKSPVKLFLADFEQVFFWRHTQKFIHFQMLMAISMKKQQELNVCRCSLFLAHISAFNNNLSLYKS